MIGKDRPITVGRKWKLKDGFLSEVCPNCNGQGYFIRYSDGVTGSTSTCSGYHNVPCVVCGGTGDPITRTNIIIN